MEEDRKIFGGKALGLSRIHRMGFSTPPAIAFRFQTRLNESDVDVIKAQMQTLGSGPWIVRSSHSDEDGLMQSLAGRFHSFFPLFTFVEVCHAIDKSLTEQLVYGLSCSVILQCFATPDFSGVMSFAGNDQEVTIVYVEGHNESITSGKASGNKVSGSPEYIKKKCSSLFPVEELLAMAHGLFHEFKHAVDIEWGIVSGKVILYQVRPLSYHLAELERQRSIEKLRKKYQKSLLVDYSISDVLPNPSVVIADAFRRGARNGYGLSKAFKRLGFFYNNVDPWKTPYPKILNRVFLDLTFYLKNISVSWIIVKPDKTKKDWFNDAQSIGLNVAAKIQVLVFPILLLKVVVKSFWLILKLPQEISLFQKNISLPFIFKHRDVDLENLSPKQVWDRFSECSEFIRGTLTEQHLLTDLLAGVLESVLALTGKVFFRDKYEKRRRFFRYRGKGNINVDLIKGIHGLKTGTISILEFKEKFGHRGAPDWDPMYPRLWEKVDGGRITKAFKPERAVFYRKWNMRMESVVKYHPIYRLYFYLHRKLGIFSELRESTQDQCIQVVACIRQQLEFLHGKLGLKKELYYLKIHEIRSFLFETHDRETLLRIARRRELRSKIFKNAYIPHILYEDSWDFINKPPVLNMDAGQFISGDIVYPGAITGNARVVERLEDLENVNSDDIIVARFADPACAFWLSQVAGFVMEQGTVLSHIALVARELGLPSMINVPSVTRIVKTGDRITIDSHAQGIYVNAT